MKNLVFFFALLFVLPYGNAQTIKALYIDSSIRLPKDTSSARKLIQALNSCLNGNVKPSSGNPYLWPEDVLETSALMDELREMEEPVSEKDSTLFNGALTNLILMDSLHYLVQLAYSGVKNNHPVLRASFELLVTQKDQSFYFSSPLKRNTSTWQKKTIGHVTFHYKQKLDEANASDYVKNVVAFNKRLKASIPVTDFYCFDFLPESMQALGMSYRSDYNGRAYTVSSATENNRYLLIDGSGGKYAYDPHDLWHSCLRKVAPRDSINRPVDEGCAYLYGGSWGISWNQILKTFHEKLSSNPNTDWLTVYEKPYNFGDSTKNQLYAGYVVNALLVEKIEKEQGFEKVMELLKCGKVQKDNANYFTTLEKLTGINRMNYNEKVWALVNENKKQKRK